MSVSSKDQNLHLNLEADAVSEADMLLRRIRGLREEIITAWQERAVVLSKFEQECLHQEIVTTCKLLTDLTRTR
jgi:hypothetical protein